MDLHLAGKSVIVMAASKGLGRATAELFAEEGAKVVITSRNVEELEKTTAEIKQKNVQAQIDYHVCDVTQVDDVKKVVAYTKEKHGSVDVLINNSGGPPAGGFDQFSDDDWQAAFELNLLSYVRAIREVIPHMREQGGGHILNFASSSIKQSLDNLLLSNTFRAGVVGLAKSLSQELAKDHILINTLGPGRIATDRLAQLDQKKAERLGQTFEDVQAGEQSAIPIGRYGEPEEFARQAVFLCSGANTYVTGQAFLVDGGLVKAL
ncbi:3-oxoacyl-[acyl-carrier protein] reductase [Alkalihalobacillus xiaoxiensis]|uniref:3-oxoacyl-[acyl-carrier protein] reductase n=1 Tax=Shouchella xiaoxiensis TaxID=766895 RepID=A0ABS2SUP5_9BACI|nr:SDR family oxidoreductase [Shouchella xiaoxiensis]MBM7839268.1 3-oxoacyl-[acyl-carrier protein] reductase [Shouchella xiaoxiensis]